MGPSAEAATNRLPGALGQIENQHVINSQDRIADLAESGQEFPLLSGEINLSDYETRRVILGLLIGRYKEDESLGRAQGKRLTKRSDNETEYIPGERSYTQFLRDVRRRQTGKEDFNKINTSLFQQMEVGVEAFKDWSEGGFNQVKGVQAETSFVESVTAYQALMEVNMKLVLKQASLVGNSRTTDEEYDDLTSDGWPGLSDAIVRFDLGRKIKFSTYAVPWIRQTMARGHDNAANTIRIPLHRVEQISVFNKVHYQLQTELYRDPDIDEIIESLKSHYEQKDIAKKRKNPRPEITRKMVAEFLELTRRRIVSLETRIDDGPRSMPLADVVGDPEVYDPYVYREKQDVPEELTLILNALRQPTTKSTKSRVIFAMTYGIVIPTLWFEPWPYEKGRWKTCGSAMRYASEQGGLSPDDIAELVRISPESIDRRMYEMRKDIQDKLFSKTVGVEEVKDEDATIELGVAAD